MSRKSCVTLLLVIASALLAIGLFIAGAIWRGRATVKPATSNQSSSSFSCGLLHCPLWQKRLAGYREGSPAGPGIKHLHQASSSWCIDPTTGQMLNSCNFGDVISTSNNPRIIQFGLKLNGARIVYRWPALAVVPHSSSQSERSCLGTVRTARGL